MAANAPSNALTVIERIEQSPAVLQLDARASALVELLPDEAAALRFRQVVIQALVKSPELLQCAPDSIVSAVFEAAAMGLEPTGAAGGAHLVSYNVNVGTKDNPRWEKRAQLIPDYRGIIRLVTKPPSDIVSMEARAVKEGDEFEYELGSDAFVRHTPSLAADRSTKATTHVYSVARLRAGGPPLVDVEDRAGIERVQKRGKDRGFSPWASDWDEMAKKTIIKRHAKVLPVRPEIRSILVREDEGASEEPAAAVTPAPAPGQTRTSRLATRLRAHAATEPATEGEVFELGEEPAPAAPEPAPAFMTGEPASEHPLAVAIRSQEAEGGRPGLPTKPLLDKLRALFMEHRIGGSAVTAGLKAIWPDLNVNEMSADQVNAIIVAAESDPEFAAHWRELAGVAVPA